MNSFSVEWHRSLTSTNAYLRELAETRNDLPDGLVIAAEHQTQGRGRRSRAWHSVPGKDLTFSLLHHASGPRKQLGSLPMVAALAVALALDRYGVEGQLKWPNDVRVGERKICGILSERAEAPNGSPRLVIGIGVNINMGPAEARKIEQPATSLFIETGRTHRLDDVLGSILQELQPVLALWEAQGFAAFRESWLERADALGHPVTVRDGDQSVRGVVVDFGTHGELILQEATGEPRTILAGDMVV